MSDLSGLVQGLSQGIDGYLQGNIQQKRQQQNMQAQQTMAQQTHAIDAQTDQDMAGKVTPDMAESLIPGSSKWVQGFQQQNGRYPTTNEATQALNEIIGKMKATDDGSDAIKKVAQTLTTYQKMYNNDKVISGEKTAAAAADTAMDQVHLAVSNPVANSSVPITLARMLTGTSRINVQEIQRLGGSQAISDRANQIATNMKEGVLTPDNASWMEDVVNTLKAAHTKNIEDRSVELASQYRQVSGEDLPTAFNKITGQSIPQRFTQRPTEHAAGSAANATEAKRKALRLKLGI